ncbi:GTPase [Agitococcus lubricus]|uniref:50S ribosome-binding GTPase n=1 Tax=Agitococcus lubricus TaxID=1077255 RepID=A0A2T5IRU4_9GAMM|nr:LeoA/HP0731 family dynamin-like GTPase [Agitococcus lubricus]PTQ86543.1 50S ribosome-binding GTPase [Agitococcus lubricus]
MKNNIEIIALAEEGSLLLAQAKSAIVSAESDEVKSLATRIPYSLEGQNGPLKLVFAGQYSAGKSSVISALTGRQDIAIGAGITTQHTHPYHWQGVDIIDTPGVHTSLRPDHDEITYRALANADLLVFVTTNELFDDHLAKHFRKLAVDRDKGREMLLLINKMQRHVAGNSLEAQQIIIEDLQKVIIPFTPEDLHISFVDAESSIRAAGHPDASVAERLWRKSGMDKFAETLNQFIREKGLIGRYTTALYSLEQVLLECLAKSSTGDLDINGLEELLLQKRRALVEEQQRIPESIRRVVTKEVEKIKDDGRKIAGMIHEDMNEKDVKIKIEEAEKRADDLSNLLNEQVKTVIGLHIEDLEKRFEAIMDSELAKELLPRLKERMDEHLKTSKISPEMANNLNKAANHSKDLGNFLVKNCFNPASSGFKAMFELKNYSGTKGHEIVKEVGKFFGKKFKPWEAVKWTKYLAHAGRVLAVAGVVLNVYLALKEDAQEVEQTKALLETRTIIRSGFNDAANAIETFFDEATQTYVTEVFTPEISAVDSQLSELREMQTQRSIQYDTFVKLLAQTQSLIRKMHQSSSAQASA